jgi:two-component system cell cycle sensor histidine kinase/response regulator CckA
VTRSGVSRRKAARGRGSGDIASLYRTLARNFPNGTLTIFDHELRYLLAEGTGAGGFTRDVLEGKTLAEALPPDIRQVLEPLFRGALAGTAGAAEVASGGGWLVVHAGPLKDEQGAIVAGMALVQDISAARGAADALRGSEARFRALVENSYDAVALIDADAKIVYASASTTRLLGYLPADLVGRNALDLIHPDDLPYARERFAAAAERPDAVVVAEYRVRHRDGSWRSIEGVGVNRIAEPGIGAIVANFRDITERKQLEERLRRAHRMDAVARLAGAIAHDYNNLLTVMLGSAEILLHDLPLAYARRDDLEQIKAAASRAAELTRQVLAYSRQQVLTPKMLDVNTLIGGMKRVLQPLVGGGVDLQLQLREGIGTVRADPVQLEQAIVNLVLNAREAMPSGGRLTLATADVAVDEAFARDHDPMSPGRYVTLVVQDQGVGMDEETRGHLFEPFFTTKPGRHGAGLGLATTYGIIKQTGGYIWVESAVGKGSSFTIYLPWHAPLPAADAARPAAAPAATGAGETVLVVDDEPAVRLVTKRILQRNGYTVLEASGGQEALRVLREHPGPIQLLLSDVIMPEMNGREVAERVRQRRPGIKVLFMSAYSPDAITHDGLLEEGAAFLRKPFEIGPLLQAVRRALDAAGVA